MPARRRRPSRASPGGTPLPEPEGRERGASPEEELRRRLYAPGAGEQDVARYRDAVPGPASSTSAPPPGPGSVRRPGRLRAAPFVVGGLAAAALIAALPLTRDPRAGSPTPSPVPSGALPVPAAASARFVQSLAASQPPRVAQYLLLHPSVRPAVMAAATRTIVDEHQGTGTVAVPLHPDLAAGSGGHVTVVLVSDRSLPLRWAVGRTAVRPDHRQYEQVVGQRSLMPRPGVPLSGTVRYDGAAPTDLLVEAEDGVRWDVVVAFTD